MPIAGRRFIGKLLRKSDKPSAASEQDEEPQGSGSTITITRYAAEACKMEREERETARARERTPTLLQADEALCRILTCGAPQEELCLGGNLQDRAGLRELTG